ncbi:MAG TPA: HAD-IA family hydrolase [Rubrobacteraceae bacterium]|nr:HAD-IA family hydrolase [Rubrobacteraceae bacterium]
MHAAATRGLAGKPAPDTFEEAVRLLGAPPERTVVVEDAISGTQDGCAGGGGRSEADVVVSDLAEPGLV